MKPNGAGILIVCHGDLSKHFQDAAHIIYQQDIDFIYTLSIKASQGPGKIDELLCAKMEEIAQKHRNVLVLCDTYGATASRLVSSQSYNRVKLKCAFGLNLPMLLEAINYKDDYELDELAELVSKIGKESIFVKQLGT